jgi:vesicular inhibitory amino acid transporter
VSERSLIIESSDDEDTHSGAATATNGRRRVVHDEEEKGSGSDSDSSSSSSSCATPRRGPCSSSPYAQQWPQSYRSCDSSLLSFLRFLENLQLAIY